MQGAALHVGLLVDAGIAFITAADAVVIKAEEDGVIVGPVLHCSV